MGIEIEAKMKVDHFDGVLKKLHAVGAHRRGAELETNIFFDSKNATLKKRDSGLRVRIAVNERGKKRCLVTFKGPAAKGKLKQRTEIEFSIDSPSSANEMFTSLGFPEELSFEKRRESWEFRGCTIALDELPILGKFVEIEGDSEKIIMTVRKSLGLGDAKLIKSGYISMLDQYVKKHRVRDRHIRL